MVPIPKQSIDDNLTSSFQKRREKFGQVIKFSIDDNGRVKILILA